MSDDWNLDENEQKESQEAPGIDFPSHESLEKQLTALEMERDQLKEKFLRQQAEMENLRRRTERDVASAHKFGSERLLSDLLPILDSLVHGLEGPEPEDEHARATRHGMQLTLDMLEKTLLKHGIVVIDAQPGDAFNPARHEAMVMQPGSGLPSHSIVQTLQKGYELNGRVLRAARVIVAQ